MAEPAKKMKKELSLFGVYALATGATLSSGFFLLPGLAVVDAGAAVFISYLLSVVPLLPGVFSKIELATAMPRAGGEYYFLDRSLGPLFGTITGLGTWCGLVLKTSFALIGIGAYLGVFFPSLPMKPIVAAAAISFGALNLFGARKSTKFQIVLVVGLLPLVAWFIITGLIHLNWDHFATLQDADPAGVFATAGLVGVSFMGLTNVASVAEEVKNPERNLPLGILLAIATAIIVYGFGTFALVGTIEVGELAGSLTPVADAAEKLVGHTGAIVMTIAALLAFLSVANAGIMSASRYPLAMSRDHLLPPPLRRLNRYDAPHHGIFITTGAILLFVTVLDPSGIAKMASAFLLLLFSLNCLAVIVMRESRIDSYDPGFRSPWYPWMQIVGIILPWTFIIVMGWLPFLFALGLCAVGTLWYVYYARPRVRRGGAVFHLFARLGQRRFEGLDRELRGILKEKGLRAKDPYDEVVARTTVIEAAPSDTFEDLVQRASEQLAVHLTLNADQLFKTFMEGTRVGATPVSKGVALPHMRLPGLDAPLMVLARSRQGVHVEVAHDFLDHAAEQAIYAVIFLVSSEENAAQHLRMLAQVAQHVDPENFMPNWLAAKNEHEMREMLLRDERYLSIRLRKRTRSSPLISTAIRDLALPEQTLIAMIHRDGDVLFPRGNTVLREGDHVTIVGLPDGIRALREQYAEK